VLRPVIRSHIHLDSPNWFCRFDRQQPQYIQFSTNLKGNSQIFLRRENGEWREIFGGNFGKCRELRTILSKFEMSCMTQKPLYQRVSRYHCILVNKNPRVQLQAAGGQSEIRTRGVSIIAF
jgi:hypothetical protein